MTMMELMSLLIVLLAGTWGWRGMSEFEARIGELLCEAFPQATVKTQYKIKYQGHTMFFDFYLPSFSVMIECQGVQHYKFVPHFHGNANEFKSQKWRDSLKREWAKKHHMYLLEIAYNEQPRYPSELFNRIYTLMESASGNSA